MMLILGWIGTLKPITTYSENSNKEHALASRYHRLNNAAMFLSLVTTFVNVMITSFNGHSLPPQTFTNNDTLR